MAFIDRLDNVAFYTRDKLKAYNLRTKCSYKNIHIEYLSTLSSLFTYMINARNSIIILDLKCINFMDIINEYCVKRNGQNIVFVYLTDRTDIRVNNYNTFVCSIKRIDEFLTQLNFICHRAKRICDEKGFCLQCVVSELEAFGISPQYLGFIYLKECILMALYSKGHPILQEDIYPKVASTYHTNVKNIEKNINRTLQKVNQEHPEAFEIDAFKGKKVTGRTFMTHVVQMVDSYLKGNKRI